MLLGSTVNLIEFCGRKHLSWQPCPGSLGQRKRAQVQSDRIFGKLSAYMSHSNYVLRPRFLVGHFYIFTLHNHLIWYHKYKYSCRNFKTLKDLSIQIALFVLKSNCANDKFNSFYWYSGQYVVCVVDNCSATLIVTETTCSNPCRKLCNRLQQQSTATLLGWLLCHCITQI